MDFKPLGILWMGDLKRVQYIQQAVAKEPNLLGCALSG